MCLCMHTCTSCHVMSRNYAMYCTVMQCAAHVNVNEQRKCKCNCICTCECKCTSNVNGI